MDDKDIVHYAVQIEKCNAERSFDNVLTLLCDLDKLHITAEQLETTDIAKALYRLLKTCSDDRVKKTTKTLLSKWKKQYSRDRQHVKSTEEREDPAQEQQEASSSQAQNGLHTGSAKCAFSSVRLKCVQLLLSSLSPGSGPDEDEVAELARSIEQHIFERHKSSQLKYKACVRSRVANLRNPKNKHLQQGLLSSSLSPETFAGMSAEEMAGAELRQLREEYSSRAVNERQLPQGVEGTPTGKIRCKRCGGSDCRVTQVSRGALFLPSWVRSGGPDDDAMTFVTCSGCGQQWYHSGWICL
ncbi:uncharacterized protein V6R79_002948 [Siganus canaliculatus]